MIIRIRPYMRSSTEYPPPPPYTPVSQLFQGKVSAAVDTGNRAVDLSQRDEDNTPDTEIVGQVSPYGHLSGCSWRPHKDASR